MRYQAIWLLLTLALLLSGCGKTVDRGETEYSYRQISQQEAMERMDQENCVILDVRTLDEFRQGHIPGAICIPNETIGDQPLPELPDLEQTILVYCRSGNRSKQAAQKLADLGYTNVMEFGGINTWPGAVTVEAEENWEAVSPILMLDGGEIGETDGIFMEVTGYSQGVLTVELTNQSGESWYYGEAFSVSKRNADGEWTDLNWPDGRAWIEIAYDLQDGERTEIRCDVSELELDSGEYKLCKGDLQASFRLVWSE